jgi:hypothetical protein
MPQSELSVHQSIEAIDLAASREGDEFDFAGVSRLKAHGGSRGDAKTEPACLLPIKVERAVGFKEMKMAPYLDRAIAPIGDDNLSHLKADIGIMWFIVGC